MELLALHEAKEEDATIVELFGIIATYNPFPYATLIHVLVIPISEVDHDIPSLLYRAYCVLYPTIRNVLLANIQQVYPWDRGTNYAIELGEKIAGIATT